MRFKFKGGRDYVQSGDMYEIFTTELGDKQFISRLQLKRLSRMELFLSTKMLSNCKAVGRLHSTSLSSNQVIGFYILEGASEVSLREPYYEDRMHEGNTQIEKNVITGHRVENFSTIEHIVSYTKKLCYATLPTLDRWIFAQIDLANRLPADWEQLTVQCSSSLGGRFTRNIIFIDNKEVGEVRFGKV
jgi:hypothetical protein